MCANFETILIYLGRMPPKEHLCQIIFKSDQCFCTRRFLKICNFSLFIQIRRTSPALWQPCFSLNRDSFNNLGRGSPKEYLCKCFFQIRPVLLHNKIFYILTTIHIRKTNSFPWKSCFLMVQNNLNNFGRGNICAK